MPPHYSDTLLEEAVTMRSLADIVPGERGRIRRSHSHARDAAGLRAGYTLAELVIVVLIVGIMAMVMLPRIAEANRRLQIDSAAQQLVGDLHRARIEALKRNTTMWIVRTDSTTYSLRFLGDRTLPDGVTFGSGSPDTVKLASFGPSLTGSRTYTLRLRDRTETVEVNAAGYASVR